MTAREAAFLSLQKFERDGKYLNIELSASIEKFKLRGAEKALYTALLYGVIERRLTLEYLLEKYSSRPVAEIDRDVKTAVLLGLYQLRFMDKIPPSAAVNESVALLRRFYAKKNSEGFANAVLRAAASDGKSPVFPKGNTARRLSVQYSVAPWICEKFIADLGFDTAEKILAASFSHPKLTLAANTLKISRDELADKLAASGIKCEKTAFSPRGVRLLENIPYDALPADEGLFFVEDEASQLCGEALGALPGDTVLDACACPGGKSFYSAVRMENHGRIVACDLHKSKLSLVSSGADRLGISIIETREQNSAEFCPELPPFDKVLCDVPCSGLGVLAKKPEIRYKSESDVARLPSVQYSILDNCSKYVRSGGTLVYSTCTVTKDENESVTEKFASLHPDFTLVSSRRLLPGDCGDGFYIAKFVKRDT